MINTSFTANAPGLDGSLATDVKDLSALRQAAQQNSPDAIKGVAKQFESLFMNMVMKSMRDASPQDGIFDSQQSKMYTSMLDQQISQNLAKRGVGLADMLIRQLSPAASPLDAKGSTGLPTAFQTAPGAAANPWTQSSSSGVADLASLTNPAVSTDLSLPESLKAARAQFLGKTNSVAAANNITSIRSTNPTVRAFHDKLAAQAEEASHSTGIPAKFMLGQAALESGWGKREIKAADGTPSHNLFGIKAGAGWTGKTASATTTEYVQGVKQTKVETFRAYDNYADSFRDYAQMMRSNPRYQNVLANAQDVNGFAQSLQRAGYATDPQYASKLTRIIQQTLA